MELTVDQICKYIGDAMECPCNYGFNGISVDEFMLENNEEWCDVNCSMFTHKDYAPCWKRFFETLAEKENNNGKTV